MARERRVTAKRMIRSAKRVGVAVILASLLAGCGVRGSLETPQAAKNEPTADANSGQGKAEGDAPKEHKGFVLDGLLR